MCESTFFYAGFDDSLVFWVYYRGLNFKRIRFEEFERSGRIRIGTLAKIAHCLEIVFTPIRVTRVQIPFSAPNEYNPNLKPILVGGAFGLFLFL